MVSSLFFLFVVVVVAVFCLIYGRLRVKEVSWLETPMTDNKMLQQKPALLAKVPGKE